MPTRPRLAVVLPLLIPLATLSAQRHELDESSRQTLEKVMKRHPFEAFRDFARGKDDPTREKWRGRHAAGAVSTAVGRAALAGLWSDDALVARGASRLLSEGKLDVVDIERYQSVVFGLLFAKEGADLIGDLVDYDVFKHTVSTADLAKVLTSRPPPGSTFLTFYLRDLHRSLRPEHLPQLCRLTRDANEHVRKQAMFSICTVTAQSNRHRELVARAMLGWERRKVAPLPAKPNGYPALLAAVLERSLAGKFRPEDPWPTQWQVRWAAEATAASEDRGLLFKLLRSDRGYMRRIAIHGLGQLRDERSIARLATHSEETEVSIERAMCHLVLARRDAEGWRVRLQQAAMDNDEMLAAALLAAPKEATAKWADRAFDRDPKTARAAVKLLGNALYSAQMLSPGLPEGTRKELVDTIERHCEDASAASLGKLIGVLPGCRTANVARAYLANLRPDDAERCDLAFLQVSDEKGLRARLESWLQDEASRDAGLEALARLGSPEHGEAMTELWKREPEDDLVLARNAESKHVRTYLEAELREMVVPEGDRKVAGGWSLPLAAVLCANGTHESTAHSLLYEIANLPIEVVRRHFPEWRRLALAGESVRVLLAVVEAQPIDHVWFPDLGRTKDPAILAFLQRAKRTPGCQVQWAISELAAAGDAEARRQMDTVFERNYYGWPDDSTGYALTFGLELDTIPYWIGEVETNCCRRVAANKAIEKATGYDIFKTIDASLQTQRAAAESWWKRFGAQLRWSRVAGRYVVALR